MRSIGQRKKRCFINAECDGSFANRKNHILPELQGSPEAAIILAVAGMR